MLNKETQSEVVVSSAVPAENISTEERWADIEGYEGSHQVSDMGRVRSLDRIITAENQVGPYSFPTKGRLLVTKPHNQLGHMVVRFSKPGEKRKEYMVHRLVAAAFVDGQQPGYIVIHEDGYKENCSASNLEWKSNCR